MRLLANRMFRSLVAMGTALPIACAAPAQATPSVVIDAATGQILEQQQPTATWYPASLTKLMTVYVALDAVRQNRLTLDTPLVISARASKMAPTKMGFRVGSEVTLRNALIMLMVKSANDIAVTIAEGVSGSVEAFADEMNKASATLGMHESNWVNPNGLPDERQVTSARDLAVLARALLLQFPQSAEYYNIGAMQLGNQIIPTHNGMLGRYPGADGMKTGFICASGFNLVATATRGNRQLIAVVLGAPSSAARAVKAAELLESGFTQNPLSWLTPALGQVDKLAAINADPPNLHDEVCGRHRKRPAAEDEEDEAGGESGGVDTPFSALLSSLRAPTPKGAALLSDFGAVTPTVVYTGPTRTPAQLANLASEAVSHHKKRGSAKTAAAKSTDEKATDKKTAHEKGADEKAKAEKDATDKKAGAHSWTPTSSSALAASPPPGLETKRDLDPPKKRHKTKPPIKPTVAQ